MEDIRYYLDNAKRAPRPINLALLGPRASGKTSILNVTEFEAKNRGYCTVRIDLDEDDSKSQMAFFFKLFDGIFSSVCETGAYEGKGGKTYDIYLDTVNTYSVPDDKTFCPFIFPIQYAKAYAGGRANAMVSDHNFKSDRSRSGRLAERCSIDT
jgi:AAA+ ATPase superfamily predicted ATPase